jgi:DNA recombination protein RmuC
MSMTEWLVPALGLLNLLLLLWLLLQLRTMIAGQMEEKHRAMLLDLNEGLNSLNDRLRHTFTQEQQTMHDAMHALKISQSEQLTTTRVEVLEKLHQTLAEQGKAGQELIQTTMRNATLQLTTSIETLTKTVDGRLEQIGGKVNERLDEGFKKTNETFISVMERLTVIDEAQKKIDGLSTNMVSLQDLLSNKSSRGAFGEVQLEGLVRNALPPDAYEFQHTLSNGSRVDCALFLPEPTGTVAVDSKFPLENYHRMYESGIAETERLLAQRQFKADVKKHVDDIANKYIIPNVTSDGAVMFIPAEAVFAEIHAYHSDIVDDAMRKRVWIVSPTTLMAVLNTARAVLKDVETRKHVHIIKDELGKLSKEFGRFNKRMDNLASHIRQAHEDVQDVHTTSQKISSRFRQIEGVEIQDIGIPSLPEEDESE